MSKKAVCRIDGIVATEAPVAVIFRRGPSKQTQLLTWNLETDEVTAGQWIKGKVFTRRSDVSPDGKYLIAAFSNYAARNENEAKKWGMKHDWMTCGWTAISRPPYFSALALWFTGGSWNGGGLWDGPKSVRVNNDPCTWHTAIAPSNQIRSRKLNLGGSEDEPIYSMLLKKRGWKVESEYKTKLTNKSAFNRYQKKWSDRLGDIMSGNFEAIMELVEDMVLPTYRMTQPGLLTKPMKNGLLRFETWLPEEERFIHRERWSIVSDDGKVVKSWVPKAWHPQFLDVDHSGRIVFGDQGRLMVWKGFPNGKPKMIADLTPNEFEPVKPPAWALKW